MMMNFESLINDPYRAGARLFTDALPRRPWSLMDTRVAGHSHLNNNNNSQQL